MDAHRFGHTVDQLLHQLLLGFSPSFGFWEAIPAIRGSRVQGVEAYENRSFQGTDSYGNCSYGYPLFRELYLGNCITPIWELHFS